MTKDEEQIVDQFLDEASTVRAGRNTVRAETGPTDEEQRLERQFLLGFQKAVDERLAGSGLRCWGVLPDGHGLGYRVRCLDQQKRQYDVDLTFDEWLGTVDRIGRDAGREMVGVVAERVIRAREKYFARML